MRKRTVRNKNNEGVRPTDVARKLGIGRTSVYRVIGTPNHEDKPTMTDYRAPQRCFIPNSLKSGRS